MSGGKEEGEGGRTGGARRVSVTETEQELQVSWSKRNCPSAVCPHLSWIFKRGSWHRFSHILLATLGINKILPAIENANEGK